MQGRSTWAYRLSGALAGLMLVQSVLGLLLPGQYRDVAQVRATWFGNDWVTLVAATPLLVASLVLARRGCAHGLLLWLGLLGYGTYNYAFYMLGAALNAFFPLYVLAVSVSAIALILALSCLDVGRIAASFGLRTPVRIIGTYFTLLAGALACAWMGIWGAYVFAGRPTPVEPEAFRLVASLDMTLMATAMGSGGILLWRRRDWGYVITAIAGIQGSLYLVVLSDNSVVAVQRGLARWPGELPVWGTLDAITTAMTAVLLANARRDFSVASSSTGSRPSD